MLWRKCTWRYQSMERITIALGTTVMCEIFSPSTALPLARVEPAGVKVLVCTGWISAMFGTWMLSVVHWLIKSSLSHFPSPNKCQPNYYVFIYLNACKTGQSGTSHQSIINMRNFVLFLFTFSPGHSGVQERSGFLLHHVVDLAIS